MHAIFIWSWGIRQRDGLPLIKYLPEILTFYCPLFVACCSCAADRAKGSRVALTPSQLVTRATRRCLLSLAFLMQRTSAFSHSCKIGGSARNVTASWVVGAPRAALKEVGSIYSRSAKEHRVLILPFWVPFLFVEKQRPENVSGFADIVGTSRLFCFVAVLFLKQTSIASHERQG